MSAEIKESVADVDGGHSSVDDVGGIVEGMDIAEVLSSAGPVVKCVILRAKTTTTITTKPLEQQKDDDDDDDDNAGGDGNNDVSEQKITTIHCKEKSLPIVLTNLIDEIDIDTTPSKSMVSKVLGGPLTFLGQYEDEGIVLMVRNLPEDILELVGEVKSSSDSGDGDNNDNNANQTTTIITIASLLKEKKLSELKGFCKELDIDMTGMIEKSDVVQEIVSRIPPINPHRLQPPLHEAVACGDIICMRVAETNEELDDDFDDDDEEEEEEEEEKEEGAATATATAISTSNDNDDTGTLPAAAAAATKKKLHVPSNDEFFLNYTKEEYIKFASRRDIDENDINSSDAAAEDSEEHKQEGGRDEGEINNDDGVGGVGDDDDGEQVEDEGFPSEQAVDDPDDDIDDPDADTGTGPSARGVYVLGGDETIDEEDKSAMFNLVMNEVLRQYREENGRGPNTQELLELRATIAKELDVEVAHVEDSDWDKKAKENSVPTGKKIGFHDEDKVLEFQPHENEHNHHHHYMDLPESVMNGHHDYDDDDDNDDDEEYENENYEPPNKRYKRDPNNDDDDDSDYDDDDNDAKKPAAKEKDTETVETKKPAPVTNGNGNGNSNGILKMPPPPPPSAAAASSSSREREEAIDTEDTANNTFAAASTNTLGSPSW